MPDPILNPREMDASFESVVENMPVAIAVYKAVDNGRDFLITAFNKFAGNIEKVDGKSILGMKITGAFPGVKKFGLLNILHSVWKTGKPQHFPSALYKDKRISGWRDNYVFRLPCGEVVAAYFDTSEQKFAEERLRESEEKFKGLFENAKDGIVMADLKTKKFIMCNPSFSRMLGVSTAECLRMGVSDIHPKKDMPFVLRQFDALACGKIKVAYNIPVLGKEGRILYVDINAFPIIMSHMRYLVGTFRDATERREKEEAVIKNEEVYMALAANIPGIVYRVLLRQKNKMVFFNKAVEGFTGYKISELTTGKVCSIDPIILPEDKKRIIGIVENAVKKKIPFEVEYRIKNKKGELRYFIERGMPVYGDDKKPLYIYGVIFDKTERKKEQELLADSERLLNEAQQLSRVGNWSMDLATGEVIWSKMLYELVEYDSSLPAPRYNQLKSFYTSQSWKLLDSAVQKALKTGEPYNLELEVINKTGKQWWQVVKGRIIRDKQGKAVKLAGTVQDITDRTKAEMEAFKAKQERLEELERFKQIAVGRELKMIELKNRIKELEEELKTK